MSSLTPNEIKAMESKLTPDEMKRFESLFRLKLLKAGEVVTAADVEAVRYFFGSLFDKIGEPKELIRIEFPDGKPVVTKGAELLKSVEVVNGSAS